MAGIARSEKIGKRTHLVCSMRNTVALSYDTVAAA
jgi:hypothetical protein